jgi:hypothetical protein
MPGSAHWFSEVFQQLGKKFKSKASRELFTYLVFLLTAVLIWYFNALNKNYTTELNFRIRYTDVPEDKALVIPPAGHMRLTVSAQGFTLLKYRLGLTLYPITLDASYKTLRQNYSSRIGEYFIATQSVFDKIASQISPDIGLKGISPDTLKFLFSETVQKNVPVKVTAQLRFEKEFMPKGNMQVVPDRITVSGPQAIIDTMQYVYTASNIFKKLKDTLRVQIALQPVGQLRYSVQEVNVIQPIERYTEATVAVPIEPVNLPEGLKMKTFPGTVTVNCLVPISDFEKVQPYIFRVAVDYSMIKDLRENQMKIRVNLLKAPDFVSDVRFQPKNVDFIVEK